MRFFRFFIAPFFCLLSVIFNFCSTEPTSTSPNSTEKPLQDSVFDVFLVAGQSNTYYGQGYDPALDKPEQGIYQLGRNKKDDMKVIEAKEPLQHFYTQEGRIGFCLAFAKLYKQQFGNNKNILLVPCGMDNTGFNGDGWNKGNFLYNDALTRTNYVLNHFPKSKIIAILWHQGEMDVDYKNYQAALDSMIVSFRKDIVGANSKTPFIMGGMVPFWVELEKARRNQQKIISETKNRLPAIGYADPYTPFRITKEKDPIDLGFFATSLKDSVDIKHYTANGQREMAKRYFEEFKKLQSK